MKLKLNGIEVKCVIGERPDEREREQALRVDVELEIADTAAATDELADTVDYAALAEKIRTALVAAKCRMIERAAKIAYDVCREDAKVLSARVTVTKSGAVPGLESASAVQGGPQGLFLQSGRGTLSTQCRRDAGDDGLLPRRRAGAGEDFCTEGRTLMTLKTTMAAALMAVGMSAAAAGVFETTDGKVAPLHQAGQPPLPLSEIGWGEKMFHYLPEAGIRRSRLHDTGGAFGDNRFVDISNLFRDFSADENDPKSYDFAFTDLLLEKMVTNGIAPFFRLGETIENHAHIKRYRTFVPADKAKWARICEHVIRHYNEGWANGYRYNIEYWEIWNEPDFTAEAWNPMWSGTPEDLYDLYEVTATHLRKCFPKIKIGGYGSCGFWAITSEEKAKRDGKDGRTAERKAQEEHHVTFFRNFLRRVKAKKIPFDFFTFHSYSPVADIVRQAEWCGEEMAKFGFGDVELNLDEWLPAPDHGKLGTARQAAEVAAVMAGLSHTRLGMAMIYDARCGTGSYSPLFNCLTYSPYPTYSVFKFYDVLYTAGTRVPVVEDRTNGFYATAAKDGRGKGWMLLSNIGPQPHALPELAAGWTAVGCRAIDAEHVDVAIRVPKAVAPDQVLLVECVRRKSGEAASSPLASDSARTCPPLTAATPESQGVSSEAILKFIDAAEKTFDGGAQGALHGFVILRHGKVIAEGSWKPFDTLAEPHMLYSHSKSFTSTAVGLVVEEGKLDLDERVVEIFSNEAPAKVSANLAQLRVRDLLTMNVGKQDHLLRDGGDWVRQFLAKDFARRPGTGFRYDSDATYMLAAIVERKTGRKLMDYLKEKLFDKIGIVTAWTTCSPQGIPCGGWGMNMTTRELARFGQLYLGRGKWDGEYVFSPLWADLATARHTWSGWINIGAKRIGEGNDWEQGYGFQFWRCTHGAYRADGANGQLTVVLPKEDMVVSVHAGLGDMQKELNLIWDNLLPAAKEAPLTENPAAQAKLKDRLAKLAIRPLNGSKSAAANPENIDRAFELKGNARAFKSVRFESAPIGCVCTLVTRAGEQKFPASFGAWAKGSIKIDPENYEGLGAYIGEHKTMASCGFQKDGSFRLKAYLTGDTGWLEFTVKDGKVEGEFWAMNGCKLESK